ncbi:SseB family protein [Nocardiopsis ansamitocini]|uniref:SseB protein N-terminal domain-containing protein n=1 Tax=Nocardiopsis ansamitocini TaxID=1670832 RepID=A0A9W6P9I8_9ACTN|nr:SseB family protein [Nocardiopsis ansamitocini]GLU49476.1 hypothetical protein Nans01_38270 [Nocardiopsis ansamitocini]
MTTPTGSAEGDSVPFPVNPVENALAEAIERTAAAPESADDTQSEGAESVSRFIGALREGSLWVPLPEGSGVQDDGSIALPTLDLKGSPFVPVFTSEEQLSARSGELPYTIIPTQDLADVLPGNVGLAVNPGNKASVPIYPETVATLAAE